MRSWRLGIIVLKRFDRKLAFANGAKPTLRMCDWYENEAGCDYVSKAFWGRDACNSVH